MKERGIFGLAAIAAAAILAACGGGGGGGTSSVPGTVTPPGNSATATPAPPSVPAGFALAKFTIKIPKGTNGSAAARKAQAIAAGTQSITLQQLQNNGLAANGPVQTFGLTSTSPGCALDQNQNVNCTFSVTAQIGTDIFLATTYSSTDGSGQPLGSGAVKLSIQQNASNQASLTLTGPVQSIVIVSNNAANSDTLWSGNGTFVPISLSQFTADQNSFSSPAPVAQPSAILTERLFIIAQDLNGNVILNPTIFDQPIVLTLSLNGGPANVTLSNTQFIACGGATSTALNNGTVQVCTPSDLVLLTLNAGPQSPSVFNGLFDANFPSLTASVAVPPTNFTPTTFNFTVEVGPPPNTGSLPVTGQ